MGDPGATDRSIVHEFSLGPIQLRLEQVVTPMGRQYELHLVEPKDHHVQLRAACESSSAEYTGELLLVMSRLLQDAGDLLRYLGAGYQYETWLDDRPFLRRRAVVRADDPGPSDETTPSPEP